MAEKKRQCGTCRFFVESQSGGHGKCTHPKRDKSLREMVLLRPNELGCRTKWGTSLWQDPADESDPFKPETPQQPTLPEPISAQLQYDDEVTSVSIAGSKTARPSFEDDVVDSGATGSGLGSWSDTAQEERRRLLFNSDREAVAGARKRHMEKKAQQRELIPFAEEDLAGRDTEQAEKKPVEPNEPIAAAKETFPPDDYVEDERSSNKDEPVYDDELVDDGVRPGSFRTPRVRKLLKDNKSPKNHKAMGLGTPAEIAVESNDPDKRGQWSSVPSITPGFELPLAGTGAAASSPSPNPSLRVAASAAPMAMSITPSRPVSQARELLSEDRLRSERARRHTEAPMAMDDDPIEPAINPAPTVTNRPRVDEAPPQRTAPVDRLKSSPLRGYHPAVKAAAARAEEEVEAPRQPRFQQEPRQRGPVAQSHQAARPFTAGWDTKADARVSATQQIHEDRQPISQPVPAPPRQRPQATSDHFQPQSQPEPRLHRESVANPQQQIDEYYGAQRQETRPHREPAARTDAEAPRARQQRRVEAPEPVRPDTPFKPRPIQISPDVPRACGTCASFRPGSQPGRGSCANEFAGPVQRVVSEDDLACQHTYGALWIPADELVWLEELNNDYPPTPRVDAMLAKRRRTLAPDTVVLPDLEELTS